MEPKNTSIVLALPVFPALIVEPPHTGGLNFEGSKKHFMLLAGPNPTIKNRKYMPISTKAQTFKMAQCTRCLCTIPLGGMAEHKMIGDH